MEIKDRHTQHTQKADVFSRRTVRPRLVKAKAETAQEALLVSLNEYGRVVPGYIAQLLVSDEATVLAQLSEQSLI